MESSRPFLYLAVVAAGIAPARSARASDVDPTGLGQPFTSTHTPMQGSVVRVVGHAHAFTTIQSAIDASADGDIVLVRSGSYSGFTIDGKGVSVVEDAGQNAIVFGVIVKNLPAGRAAVLHGLTIQSGNSALRATDNLGVLRIDACRCTAAAGGGVDGASFVNCAAVAINESTFIGGPNTAPSLPPVMGIGASGSVLALHDSFATGWSGRWILLGETWVMLPPAPGLSMTGGTLYIAGGEIRGGEGAWGFDGDCVNGPAPTAGSDGGVGVVLTSGATAVVLDAAVSGGVGGLGGCGDENCDCIAPDGALGPAFSNPGWVTTLSGSYRGIATVPPTRERETLQLHVTGDPGDRAYLAFSPHAAHVPTLTQNGARYFQLPPRRVFLGTVNAIGALDAAFPVASIGPGADGVRWFAQAVLVDPAGQIWLGPPANLTLLDSTL